MGGAFIFGIFSHFQKLTYILNKKGIFSHFLERGKIPTFSFNEPFPKKKPSENIETVVEDNEDSWTDEERFQNNVISLESNPPEVKSVIP